MDNGCSSPAQKKPSNGTISEHDAAHPRFVEPLKGTELEKYEAENLYYCTTCKEYFDTSLDAVKFHFRNKLRKHAPYGPCFYCKGPVYLYMYKGEKKYYHNCNSD